uniref:Glutamine amidotransferase type-2 domain-containing protein n=1 Tax=Romanomermis culicivorax TaxID=13658 RepID=A0A915JAM9_ROMCU
MCGICCILPCPDRKKVDPQWIQRSCLHDLLKCRGPDHFSTSQIPLNGPRGDDCFLTFVSSVLSMRSSSLTRQPLENSKTGDILLFNGEIFSGFGSSASSFDYAEINDGEILLNDLSNLNRDEDILRYVQNLSGPYSFILYKRTFYYILQKSLQKLYAARDYFGQRSLTMSMSSDDNHFVISSILPKNIDLRFEMEIDAGRLYSIDLNNYLASKIVNLDDLQNSCLKIYPFNDEIYNVPLNLDDKIDAEIDFDLSCKIYQKEITDFSENLSNAIKKRLDCLYEKYKMMSNNENVAKIAVLFSGGVDSLLLTLLINQLWPENWPIDLLNLSFGKNLPDKNVNYDSPDRLEGRKSFLELKCVIEKRNFRRRRFNFVEINVEKQELEKMRREKIAHLIRPAKTVMDDSLGCILWFAARGRGFLDDEEYVSQARALFLGSGADELLGGYARTHFRNFGYPGLAQLLTKELTEISTRNFGRDDRVISDNGKESHSPFMDLDFIKFCHKFLPLNLKTRLDWAKVLYENGFRRATFLPKKAMQFGTRLAKMEEKSEKGSDFCRRLFTNDYVDENSNKKKM